MSATSASNDPTSSVDGDYRVRAVDRVCSILDRLQISAEGISLGDVAQATGLPKSSAFRYLWTLEARRYVERISGTGMYRLGLGFVGMQSRQVDILREQARPWLEKIRDSLGETSNLGILDGDSVIYLEIVESRRGVRLAAHSGDRDPIHSTALGKAIAAHLPESRVRELLSRTGLPPRTDRTITETDAFMGELERVRRVGFAVDDEENEHGGRCVAVPLVGIRLPAALSLSAPSSRLKQSQVAQVARSLTEIAELLTGPQPGADLAAGS